MPSRLSSSLPSLNTKHVLQSTQPLQSRILPSSPEAHLTIYEALGLQQESSSNTDGSQEASSAVTSGGASDWDVGLGAVLWGSWDGGAVALDGGWAASSTWADWDDGGADGRAVHSTWADGSCGGSTCGNGDDRDVGGWHASGVSDGAQDDWGSNAGGCRWDNSRVGNGRGDIGGWWGHGSRSVDWADSCGGDDGGGLGANWAVGHVCWAGGDGVLLGDVDG